MKPISDPPKLGRTVFVINEDWVDDGSPAIEKCRLVRLIGDQCKFVREDGSTFQNPTHWTEIPKAADRSVVYQGAQPIQCHIWRAIRMIPEGWFLHKLEDHRTPIRYVNDVHEHLTWNCEIQYVDGGGRRCTGSGEDPEKAIVAATVEVRRWMLKEVQRRRGVMS